MTNRGLGLLERPSFETRICPRQLNVTLSPTHTTSSQMTKEASLQHRLTSETASLNELLPKGTLAVDVQVISHEATVPQETEPSALLPAGEDLVAVVANLGVLDALLVVLPETLDATGALVLVPHIVTPCTLDATGHVVPIAVTHRFECEELHSRMSGQR